MKGFLVFFATLALCNAYTIITFEQIQFSATDIQQGGQKAVGNFYYNPYKITFDNALQAVMKKNSGSGDNFNNNPSGTVVGIVSSAAASPVGFMNAENGFGSLAFQYSYYLPSGGPSGTVPATIKFFTEANGGGTLLASFDLPAQVENQANSQTKWTRRYFTFTGVAKSARIETSLSNTFLYDDLVFDGPKYDCNDKKCGAHGGICLDPMGVDFCSCNDGYSSNGGSCKTNPDFTGTAPTAQPVDKNIVTFPYEIKFDETSFDPKITVKMPYYVTSGSTGYATTTTISFGGVNTDCDLPVNTNWKGSYNGNWEQYDNQFTWNKLMTKCGFQSSVSGNFRVFKNTISITKNFELKWKSKTFTRRVTVKEDVEVKFPLYTSSAKVMNNILDSETAASISEVIFSGSTWKIQLSTFITTPYQLVLTTPSNPFQIAGDTPSTRRQFTWTNSGNTPCEAVNGYCRQNFIFEVNSCDSVTIPTPSGVNNQDNKFLLSFTMQCSSGVSPCTPSTTPISVSLDLKTASACTFDKEYSITPTLSSYDYTGDVKGSSKTLFASSEKAYFVVNFDLPPLALADSNGIVLTSVCTYTGAAKTECPADHKLDFASLEWKTVAPEGNNRIEFWAKASALKLRSKVAQNGGPIKVHADITLNYKNAKKRTDQVQIFSGDADIVILESPVIQENALINQNIQEIHQLAIKSSSSSIKIGVLAIVFGFLSALL